MNYADEAVRLIVERRRANLPDVGEDGPLKYAPDFGKYKGVKVVDIPTPYLKWIVEEFEPGSWQRYFYAAALKEFDRRMECSRAEGRSLESARGLRKATRGNIDAADPAASKAQSPGSHS